MHVQPLRRARRPLFASLSQKQPPTFQPLVISTFIHRLQLRKRDENDVCASFAAACVSPTAVARFASLPGHRAWNAAAASNPILPSTYTSPTVVVPIIAQRIALPAELRAVPLLTLLPPSLAVTYADPESLRRPAAEVAQLNKTDPLAPPRVAGSRAEFIKLLRRMRAAGMLDFTSAPLAVNGLFAVAKDTDSDRLIIDAQPANRLFIDPPHVRLPNASHLIQLQVPKGSAVFVAKSDLSNFYHHLSLPVAWQSYFCLPPLTAEELRAEGWDGDRRFPMCTTLPMGFSHAVVLAQSVHEHQMYDSSVSPAPLRASDNILSLRSPRLRSNVVVHGLYVDDLFILSLSRRLATSTLQASLTRYATSRLPVSAKKVIHPTAEPVKVIGFMIDGRRCTIYLDAKDSLQLLSQTLAVLRQEAITGHGLSQLVGSWTWSAMLRRPTLTLLQHSYRFSEVAQRRRFVIWPSVVHELLAMCSMLPLLHADLQAAFADTVYATDASTLAAGVCSTPASPTRSDALWPLCSSPHISMLDMQSVVAQELRTRSPALAPTLQLAVSSARWATLISSRWRHAQHINALELHAVLLALRHYLSSPRSISTRLFCLVDSAVAFFVLWKGRTSSRTLLHVNRQIMATLLANGVSLLPCWIPSEWNPADAPSRLRITHHDAAPH